MTPIANPSISRRERRSHELQQRLLDAALELFAKKGFHETTVQDITSAADVGKGTFFNYFPSKDHILATFAQIQAGKVQTAADNVANTKLPIREYLIELAIDLNSMKARRPSLVRAILQANLSSSPVRQNMKEIHANATGLLARILKEGQKRGEVRKDLDVQAAAQVVRQTLLGALLLWSIREEGSLEQQVQTTMGILWSGLSENSPKLSSAPGAGNGKTS